MSETRNWMADLLLQENPPKCTFWSHKLVQAAGGVLLYPKFEFGKLICCPRKTLPKVRFRATNCPRQSQGTFEATTKTPQASKSASQA